MKLPESSGSRVEPRNFSRPYIDRPFVDGGAFSFQLDDVTGPGNAIK